MIDTHAHIAMPGYDGGLVGVLDRALQAGVEHIVCVGAGGTIGEAQLALDAARTHAGISAICGIHPHDAEAVGEGLWAQIQRLCAEPEVVGVGETGFDFHYSLSSAQDQDRVFRRHVRLAIELRKPLCIHTRNAEPQTLALLREEGAGACGGVVHCFSGTRAFGLQMVEFGFYLGIPGIVTFKNPGELIETVRDVPIDRLVIETDSPFLAPAPYRGKRNEPLMVAETLRKVAEIKGISTQEADAATTANAVRLFGPRLATGLVAPPRSTDSAAIA